MTLAVTLGDPHGVGPEILLRSWAAGRLAEPFVAIGDAALLAECSRRLGLAVTLAEAAEPVAGALTVLPGEPLDPARLEPGTLSAAAGRAGLAWLRQGVAEVRAGHYDALVTLPLNKEAVRLSEPGFTGHTEVLAAACGVRDYALALVSDRLVATHVSTHVSLREAIARVRRGRIVTVCGLTAELCGRLRRRGPIAVMGLNPHAGEGGAFGDEEVREIAPAVDEARADGIEVAGPLPPDTVFPRALAGEFAGVVCMYHDQGHIPMKTLGFERTVNVTAGLPIVRTSVDHGTAFDIAWRGVASTGSLERACAVAAALVGAPTG